MVMSCGLTPLCEQMVVILGLVRSMSNLHTDAEFAVTSSPNDKAQMMFKVDAVSCMFSLVMLAFSFADNCF